MTECSHEDAPILQKMLDMANRYALKGDRRQALDLLWKVLRHSRSGPHAQSAKQSIMTISQSYESEGARHMAVHLLEKLLHV